MALVAIPLFIYHTWLLNQWLGFEISLSLWESSISNFLVLVGSITIFDILMKFVPGSGKFWFAAGLSLAISFIISYLVLYCMHQVIKGPDNYYAFLAGTMPLRLGIFFLILFSFSVCIIFYKQLVEKREVSDREANTEHLVRQAELRKLQLQLQPHFLFNCLNSVNAMILLNPTDARNMVQQLSDFLRLTLKRADQQWISLEEELEYIKHYLSIEKIRFGHRLDISLVIDPLGRSFQIPPLVLQPIIENAIKFGLYGTTEKVMITIHAGIREGILEIVISNPFDDDMRPPAGSGFGLSGLHRRLYLIFGRNDLIQTNSRNGNFNVILRIPEIR